MSFPSSTPERVIVPAHVSFSQGTLWLVLSNEYIVYLNGFLNQAEFLQIVNDLNERFNAASQDFKSRWEKIKFNKKRPLICGEFSQNIYFVHFCWPCIQKSGSCGSVDHHWVHYDESPKRTRILWRLACIRWACRWRSGVHHAFFSRVEENEVRAGTSCGALQGSCSRDISTRIRQIECYISLPWHPVSVKFRYWSPPHWNWNCLQ